MKNLDMKAVVSYRADIFMAYFLIIPFYDNSSLHSSFLNNLHRVRKVDIL